MRAILATLVASSVVLSAGYFIILQACSRTEDTAFLEVADILLQRGQANLSMEVLMVGITLSGNPAEFEFQMAQAALKLQQYDKALEHLQNASQSNPDDPKVEAARKEVEAAQEAEINGIVTRVHALKLAKQFSEASDLLDSSLLRFPLSDKIMAEKGGLHWDLKQWPQAAVWFGKALQARPDNQHYAINLVNALNKAGKINDSVAILRNVTRMREPPPSLLAAYVMVMRKANDWTDYAPLKSKLMTFIKGLISETGDWLGSSPCPVDPFSALHLTDDPFILRAISQSHIRVLEGRVRTVRLPPVEERHRNSRIKLGYVSYDYRNHPVGRAIQEVLEYHNRSQFEVFAYDTYNVPVEAKGDKVFQDIKSKVEHMVSLPRGINVGDLVRHFTSDNIDFLVDLGIFTTGHRMDAFMAHGVPLQLSGIGLATTTGSSHIDYLLTDRVVVPPEERSHYDEHMLYMPQGVAYHPFGHALMYPELPVQCARSTPGMFLDGVELEGRVLFCNMANNERLTPESFDRWVSIVRRTPNATLVLKYYNGDVAANVRHEAIIRGLRTEAPNVQLAFMHGTAGAQHLSWKSTCDVYLDTFPYNGHSTSADMLWAGVPMVTFQGRSIASRAASSFAQALNMAEMVVSSWNEYEELAVHWGKNATLRSSVRARLFKARKDANLFDLRHWVAALENRISWAVNRFYSGLPPADAPA